MHASSAYYIARKAKLLQDFDRSAKILREVLVASFGEDQLSTAVAETRREYENIIPQLPYIGGKQPFTQFVIATGLFLAVYRVSRAHGKSPEQTGVLIYELCRCYLQAYPVFLRRFFGSMNFSRLYLDSLRKRAKESHLRRYPGDYVYDFIEGDGVHFDYGVDYLECASCKFLAEQDALELLPYLCAVDVLYSEKLRWGLSRTMTLAEGAAKCDFRFKKGGRTNVAVPAALKPVIAKSLTTGRH